MANNLEEINVTPESELEHKSASATSSIPFGLAEKKRSELSEELSDEQLAQTEKIETLRQLANQVAHELNNPFAFIAGHISIINQYAHDLLNLIQLYQKHYPNPVSEIQAEINAVDLPFLQESFLKSLASMKIGVNSLQQSVLSLRKFSHSETEINAVNVQLVQTEKIENLRQLANQVAHELNNPIDFICGDLSPTEQYALELLNIIQLYQKYYPNPVPEIQAEIDEVDLPFLQEDFLNSLVLIKAGIKRIREIILSLRKFSRGETGFKTVNIHEGIDHTLLILQQRLKNRPESQAIQFIRNYSNLPLLECCHPGNLNQAFLSILKNAIDAIEQTNSKRTDQEIQENPSQITIRTSLIDSKWIEIAISDNGCGMSKSVRERIFDPFFTTKTFGNGGCIGLSIISYIITETYDGKLDCFSELGKGSEFIIKIPVQQNRERWCC